jgi:hypothetical protein
MSALARTSTVMGCLALVLWVRTGGAENAVRWTVHCFDGETTASSSASCLIGNHGTDRLSVQLVEKATSVQNELRAECDG